MFYATHSYPNPPGMFADMKTLEWRARSHTRGRVRVLRRTSTNWPA